jgi:hypothetical protein
MWGAVRDVTPLRSIRMRDRAYNFSVHFSAGPIPHAGANSYDTKKDLNCSEKHSKCINLVFWPACDKRQSFYSQAIFLMNNLTYHYATLLTRNLRCTWRMHLVGISARLSIVVLSVQCRNCLAYPIPTSSPHSLSSILKPGCFLAYCLFLSGISTRCMYVLV